MLPDQIINVVLASLFAMAVTGEEGQPAPDLPVPVEDVRPDFKHQITKDHVLEELQHQINTKEKKDMTTRELQFHYFKLHDFDNNNLLDGLEIVKAIKHSHEEAKIDDRAPSEHQTSEDQVISIVDQVLETDDYNRDGYISFHEFMSSQDHSTKS